MKRNTAGDQNPKIGTGAEQASDIRGGIRDLLEVVQYQQGFSGTHGLDDPRRMTSLQIAAKTQRGGDGIEHQRGVHDWRERDKPDPAIAFRFQVSGYPERQAGFAHPAGSGEGQQPEIVAAKHVQGGGDIVVAAHEGCRLQRQAGAATCMGGRRAVWVLGIRGASRWPGREQLLALGAGQVEGIGEDSDGAGIRIPPFPSFDGTDGVWREVGAFGQLLLGEPGIPPELAKCGGECVRRGLIHLKNHPMMRPRGCGRRNWDVSRAKCPKRMNSVWVVYVD